MLNVEGFMDGLEKGAQIMGTKLTKAQISLMTIHAEELMVWNETMNLTAITDVMALAEKQYLDALPLAGLIPMEAEVLDWGAGGGFPGVPLKIIRPDLRVTMVDARRKKVNFLKHVIRLMGVGGLEARHQRGEELAACDRSMRFDVVVSKAVSSWKDLVTMATPLLREKGVLISMAGGEEPAPATETSSRGAGKGRIMRKTAYALPFSGLSRHLISIRI